MGRAVEQQRVDEQEDSQQTDDDGEAATQRGLRERAARRIAPTSAPTAVDADRAIVIGDVDVGADGEVAGERGEPGERDDDERGGDRAAEA